MAMKTLTTSPFQRWAAKQGIENSQLLAAAKDLAAGLADANPLGHHLWKFRVAKAGRGKSAGFRVFAAYMKDDRLIYIHGMQKTDGDNIPKGELRALKEISATLATLSNNDLQEQIRIGKLHLLKT